MSDAIFKQVLDVAESALKEAAGLTSLRGVPLDELEAVGARIVEYVCTDAGGLGLKPIVLEPGDHPEALAQFIRALLGHRGIVAPAMLIERAQVEVWDAVEVDRDLNAGYWRGRYWLNPNKQQLEQAVNEAIELHGLEAVKTERFNYAVEVALAKMGVGYEGAAPDMADMQAIWKLVNRPLPPRVKTIAKDVLKTNPGISVAEGIAAITAAARILLPSEGLSMTKLRNLLQELRRGG